MPQSGPRWPAASLRSSFRLRSRCAASSGRSVARPASPSFPIGLQPVRRSVTTVLCRRGLSAARGRDAAHAACSPSRCSRELPSEGASSRGVRHVISNHSPLLASLRRARVPGWSEAVFPLHLLQALAVHTRLLGVVARGTSGPVREVCLGRRRCVLRRAGPPGAVFAVSLVAHLEAVFKIGLEPI